MNRDYKKLLPICFSVFCALVAAVAICYWYVGDNASGRTTSPITREGAHNNCLDILPDSESKPPVEVKDTCGLRVYFPDYSRIDLVCGAMPSKGDKSVIMFAEAAFTGELLEAFKHSNIAGDHVSAGRREKGFRCKRNNGAFVWYDGTPRFLHRNYSAAFDTAARNGGCGFAQEMMIHRGKTVAHTRSASNRNEFRALCLIGGRVAIADSKGIVKFGDFIESLHKAGATEALYLDMGTGWNYSWYRGPDGEPIEIHPLPSKYATNWITFYK